MASSREKGKASGNLFDEDITSVYQLDIPQPERHVYTFEVLDIRGEDEQYMVNAFHQQYVAVEGRAAMATVVNTRVGDIATHASLTMGKTMENVERIEAAVPLGRLQKRFHDFDNKLLDQTARHLLETNAIAVRTMHEDIRRNIYKPPPPPPVPPRRKRKGLIPGFVEFLFGEA